MLQNERMSLRQTTPVPNRLFDEYLPNLSLSELRVLLIVLRQTNGWHDKETGGRKKKDRITHNQFIQKTGLSRRTLSGAIERLVEHGLLVVTDAHGNELRSSYERSGKSVLVYACTLAGPVQKKTPACAHRAPKPVQKGIQNKRKRKETFSKETGDAVRIGEIIKEIRQQLSL